MSKRTKSKSSIEVPVEVAPVELLAPAPPPPPPVIVQHQWTAAAPWAKGLKCPKCHCIQFSDGKCVRDTDRMENAIRRYRVCRNCGRVWTTIER